MWQVVPGVGEAFGLGVGGAPPAPIGRFDTDLVPARDRVDYYHTMLRSLVCAATPTLDRDRGAPRVQVRNGRLGEALFAHFAATPHRIERTRADAEAASTGCFFLLQQTTGAPAMVRLAQAEHRLERGDCLLGDADSPFEVQAAAGLGFSLFLLPKWMVEMTLSPTARDRLLAGMRTPGQGPMGTVMNGWLASLSDASDLPAPAAAGVGAILGRLVAVAAEDGGASAEPDRDALRSARTVSVLREIDHRYHDPSFGPAAAAATLGLSLRSLHLAMEPTGLSFSEHLTRRRLAESRTLLAAGNGRTILDIALACGFNDLSTFYRAFRRAFAAAPRDLSPPRAR
jgi:AraC-like DNA-binding protein